ncbi:HET-domain-containing protein [Daldinia vernicosa]|uniref:HET-domain-containing protein n=1 Tax=Daldinia vernicosa TaxID=114800 RepID=UPI00200899D0|nr:HET-domain-containing protein [Daldinia vernicosa]KAI0846463.1 HET-domain-containing protein [Daldinia vernicosa]
MTVDSGHGVKTVSLVKTLPPLDNRLNFDIPDSTDCTQTWSMISRWMETCLRHHSLCPLRPGSKNYRPTRLLKINCSHDSYSPNTASFQLISRDEDSPVSSYAALSYRWGDKPLDKTLRLLKSTSAWLEKPNAVDHLPKTLKDAIYIAYRLGVRYIWIDRLCIYQDSPEDWRREAGSMQDVYRNSVFCISALGADDDGGGCFFSRDPSLVAPTAVDMYNNGEIFRAELEDTAWYAAFRHEPLIRRAWVLQERLMVPRTIYFGRKQVFWECEESHACETHPKGFERSRSAFNPAGADKHEKHVDIGFPLWKQLIAIPTTPRIEKDPRTRILADWSAAVSLYSNTKLTVSGDKLVAVSGLAKDVRKALQRLRPGRYRYLAGLWEDHLIVTLGWYVRVGTPASRAACYRAPSWSWASLDGHLIIPDTFREGVVEISSLSSANIALLGADDTGEVAEGILTLHGPICLIEAYILSHNQYAVETFREFGTGHSVKVRVNESRQHQSTVIFDTSGDYCNNFVCIWTIAQPVVLGGWRVSGLALRHVRNDTFLRVGVVSSYHMTQAELGTFIDRFSPKEVRLV